MHNVENFLLMLVASYNITKVQYVYLMQYLSYLIIVVVMPIVTMPSAPTATSHQFYTLQYCMKY